jgi:hypothetical protein
MGIIYYKCRSIAKCMYMIIDRWTMEGLNHCPLTLKFKGIFVIANKKSSTIGEGFY